MSFSRIQPRVVGAGLILAVVTAALYSPLRNSELISYDDPEYVLWNVDIQKGLTSDALKWAFTTDYAGNWHPLTWLSYMADYQFFGGTAAAMHLVNVALHILNSLLVLFLFWRTTRALWRSVLIAALFALHPLHVESVAWVAERKDVLCAFFGLLSLWAWTLYVFRAERVVGSGFKVQGSGFKVQSSKFKVQGSRFSNPNKPAIWYVVSFLLFALSLMSKPMLVTLPFILLLFDIWPFKRVSSVKCQVSSEEAPRNPGARHPKSSIENRASGIQHPASSIRRLLLEKLPFFALSFVDSLLTLRAQKAGGAVVPTDFLSVPDRMGNALMAYWHYLRDAVWPTRLSICYPAAGQWRSWEPLLAGALLASITALILWQRRRSYLIVGWLWFLGTLVPVIGLVQAGAQTVADRFMYFPLLGLGIAVIWGASDLVGSRPAGKAILLAAATAALGIFAAITNRQVAFWHDDLTVFGRAVEINPGNFTARNLYAIGLQKQERYDEAFAQVTEALRLNPRFGAAHANLAVHLGLRGDLQGAMTHARTALEINAGDAEAHDILGVALLKLGQTQEAEAHFRQAIQLRGSLANARNHLACLLIQERRWDEASAQLREALRYEPASAEFQQNLNYALGRQVQ